MTAVVGFNRFWLKEELKQHASLAAICACVVVAFVLGWFGHRPAQPSIPKRESPLACGQNPVILDHSQQRSDR